MNTILKTIIILAVVVLIGLVYFSVQKKSTNQEASVEENISNENEEEIITEEATTVRIPLAPMEEAGEFGPFGCGQYLNFHPIEVPKTSGVLSAVYTQLFSLPYEVSGTDDKNIITAQENLNFDSVVISDGDALVYLSGSVMGNHCADEVFRHQIEQAAFQFDSIDSITVFVNNEIFNWCSISDAGPDEGPCADGPILWIKQKN